MPAIRSACSASKVCSACSMRVSTSPMPRMREAIRSGWKTSKSVELLAGGGEHDRLAGHVPDRQRGTTAGVAVELGQHDAGEADALLERRARWSPRPGRSSRRRRTASRRAGRRRGCRRPAAISSASMPSRPAVSTTTTSCMVRRACSMESARHPDRVADAVAGLGRVDVDAGLPGRRPAAAGRRWAAAGRRRPAAGCGPGSSASGRACRRASSYRSPAGRPA